MNLAIVVAAKNLSAVVRHIKKSRYNPPMDLSKADMTILAPQLRKPEGELGRVLGEFMSKNNGEAIAFTLDRLGVEPRDHVLEVGFGPGEGIAQAVQLTPQGFVAGIDYSEEMLIMAQERNHRALMEESADVALGDAKELPYDDESFDKYFAVNVFHFWKDPTQELAECRRVLKPGGRAAFFMPYPSSWRPGLRETGVFVSREPEDVETCLRDAGFKNVHSKEITLSRDGEDFRGFVTVGERA